MLQSRVTFDQADINRAIKVLRETDSNLVRELRSGLKRSIEPVTAKIASSIPRDSKLRGMNHRGRTRWRGVNKPVVNFTPGRSRKSGTRLVSISVTGGARGLGFDYGELAGLRRNTPKPRSKEYQRRGDKVMRTHRIAGQGDGMIEGLEKYYPIRGRAGRFAFDAFLDSRPYVQGIAMVAVNKLAAETNQKLRAM